MYLYKYILNIIIYDKKRCVINCYEEIIKNLAIVNSSKLHSAHTVLLAHTIGL